MNVLSKVCEVKLSYRTKVKASERPKIRCSKNAYEILINSVFDKDSIEHRESMNVILLDRAGKVLGYHTVSTGGMSGTILDVKIILQAAILASASAVILSHNHPSGNVNPSREDDLATIKVKAACEAVDISLFDHIIVTTDRYYSYSEEGRII